ncbi:MAG: hypothetical protein GXN96_06890 [Aquificae bacterium]|nr:hypothetical protein [Aquificota bacterium]
MKTLFIILATVNLIFILNCATSQVYREVQKDTIEIGYEYRDLKSLSGYFVLIEQKDGKWNIKEISETPLKRQNTSQEVLFIDKTFKYVQPAFEWAPSYKGGTFECNLLNKFDSYYSKYYNPCNSSLTKVEVGKSLGKNVLALLLTYGLASGSHRSLDIEKILKIIEETDLINQVKQFARECNSLKEEVYSFLDRIRVEPKIIDKSGFYNGERIYSVDKEVRSQLYCPFKIEEVEYSVRLNIYPQDFHIVADKTFFKLKYNQKGYLLQPKLELLHKKFVNVFPKYKAEDEIIGVYSDGSSFVFTNKTDKYVKVTIISVYYNDSIAVTPLHKPIEMAPYSRTKPFKIDGFVNSEILKLSTYNLTKEKALNTNFLFGVAVKYVFLNQEKTLYSSRTYNLYRVLCELDKIPCEKN